MIWICAVVGLIISFLLGMMSMYYKNRNLINNQQALYDELKNNKLILNEYQKELNSYFTNNIQLLNKISENYRQLYQNITKSANLFLPNAHIKNDSDTHNNTLNFKNKCVDDEQLIITAPLDYSNNSDNNTTK